MISATLNRALIGRRDQILRSVVVSSVDKPSASDDKVLMNRVEPIPDTVGGLERLTIIQRSGAIDDDAELAELNVRLYGRMEALRSATRGKRNRRLDPPGASRLMMRATVGWTVNNGWAEAIRIKSVSRITPAQTRMNRRGFYGDSGRSISQ